MDATLKRYSPLSGVAFAVLYAVATIVGRKDSPDFAGDPASIQAYFEEYHGTIVFGGVLGLISLPFWFLYLGNLRSAIAKVEGGAGRLAATVFGAGVAAGAVGGAGIGLGVMGAYRAGDSGKIDPAVATVMWDASQVLTYTATAAVLSAFALAFGVASFRYGAVIPKWLGAVSVVFAVAFVIPPISWAALLLGVIFTLIVSVLLFQQNAGEL
jgi:hypothetical protein